MKSLLILEEEEWALLYYPAKNTLEQLRQVIWAPEFEYKNKLAEQYENLLKRLEPLMKKQNDSSQQKITRFTDKEG